MNVAVQRAYRYRLYPTAAQDAELREWERQLRWLYNLAHEQRLAAIARPVGERPGDTLFAQARANRELAAACAQQWIADLNAGWYAAAYENLRRAKFRLRQSREFFKQASAQRIDYYRQSREMTEIIRELPGPDADQIERVVCCARQEVLRDVEKAWQRWRKLRTGRPRFKRRIDAVRIYLSTAKHWKVEGHFLHLAGIASTIGPLKLPREDRSKGAGYARKARPNRRPRPWPGDREHPWTSCAIVRDGTEWYAVFPLSHSIEVEPAPADRAVGLNRGAIHAIADSDGRIAESPRFYARALDRIARYNRVLARRTDRKARPVRYRSFAAEHGPIDALAQRFATSVGDVLYQVKRRGGLEQAAAYLEAHPPPRKEPSAAPEQPGRPLRRNRLKAAQKLARAHQVVRRQRQWWLHEQSAYYASRYSTIALEDISTRQIVQSAKAEEKLHWSSTCKRDLGGDRCTEPVFRGRLCRKHYDEQRYVPKGAVRRSILDVGWYELARQLKYKSAPYGGRVLETPPAHVSRIDSESGVVRENGASGRAVWTTESGAVVLGDVNAARNVLGRALASAPAAPKTPKASIKIKGRRAKALRTETAAKPAVEACGGDAPVRAPVDPGTRDP